MSGPKHDDRSFRAAVKTFLLRLVLPVLFGAAATFAVVEVIHMQGKALVEAELQATADRAIAAAEGPVVEATAYLSKLAEGPALGCSDLPRLAADVSRSRVVGDLLLVDTTGAVMCAALATGERAAVLLPHVTARMPTVTIMPDPREGRTGLLVTWASRNGPRLVAELDQRLPILPRAAAFADGAVRVWVGLADGRTWRVEGPEAARLGEAPIHVRTVSRSFPLVADIVAAEAIVPHAFAVIETWIVVSGSVIAFLFLLTGGRRTIAAIPRRVRHKPVAIAYRPVIRIDEGLIIGLDVAARERDDDPSTPVPEPSIAIAEMGDLLREQPDLKLSLPVDAGPDRLSGLRRRLDDAVRANRLEPNQIVLRVPAASLRRTGVAVRLEELRDAGFLIALDGFAAGGGLVELVRHRPDFLILDGDLIAEVHESSEVLGIVDAVVAMARRLGMGVIARDIGSEAEISALRKVGITSGTGPVFGPSVRAAAVAELLEAERSRFANHGLAA